MHCYRLPIVVDELAYALYSVPFTVHRLKLTRMHKTKPYERCFTELSITVRQCMIMRQLATMQTEEQKKKRQIRLRLRVG